MEKAIAQILDRLRSGGTLDARSLDKLLRDLDAAEHNKTRRYVKKRLMPYYLQVKRTEPKLWDSWNIDEALEAELIRVIQVKPRRSASGVATITVITRPWPCRNSCLYCPNDLRMPKSYLSDEPACQRALRNHFDPYLQVAARLRTLTEMGHPTDKIELIVLGGSWTDYPREYRTWFICGLFSALNDTPERRAKTIKKLEALYAAGGFGEANAQDKRIEALQTRVDSGELSYNAAIRELYGGQLPPLPRPERASTAALLAQQKLNESAAHRNVGLVVETRPDALSFSVLRELRELGCTKVQIGVQTLNEQIMRANNRPATRAMLANSFTLLRIFGYKIHSHFMVNLCGATPQADIADFRDFAWSLDFQPDEIKLYPCALIGGTGLVAKFREGTWRPYTEEELVDVLTADVLATQPFTRISRMIRDFSAGDIVAGNKKTNLRQLIEERLARCEQPVQEIRFREVGEEDVDLSTLELAEYPYSAGATREVFLQWVTPENKIAGFLRLSLPSQAYVREHAADLPIHLGEAMIREVHVYGRVAQIHKENGSAQHTGLGRALIERASCIARECGYTKLNVISAVGTRNYYRKLGFVDVGLYQQKWL